MELCIKSDANNGQQYQKWLFAVSKINKIGIGLISIFLLKARVSYLTISKRKNLSLPLKDETDQFVTCLVLPECLSVKIAFHPWTVKRIVMAPMPSLLFRCFSLFLPHLRTLAQEKRSEIVFVLGLVGGVSVSIHYCREISEYFPHAINNGRSREKKFLAKRFAHAISARVHYQDLEHAYVTEFDCVALLAML